MSNKNHNNPFSELNISVRDKKQISDFLSKNDESYFSLSEVFWENTKLYATIDASPIDDDPIAKSNVLAELRHIELMEELIVSGNKKYSTFPQIKLPKPYLPDKVSLRHVFENRKSTRDFERDSPIKIKQLSTLLYYSYGWKLEIGDAGYRFKYVPSAGGLFPLEFYVGYSDISNFNEITLCHYQPNEHVLEKLSKFPREKLSDFFAFIPWVTEASAVIFITGVISRLSWKYGERALRYLLLDAGHVAQNACLLGAALKIGICPVVGFYDDKIHDLLDIDGISEIIVYTLILGKSKK